MKLRNNLYSITETEFSHDKQNFKIILNSSCFIYTAHLPGMPITPGVCIIQIIEELLSEYRKKPLQLSAVKFAKFLSVLKPEGQELYVTFTSIKEMNEIINSMVVVSDLSGIVYAKVSLQAIAA